MRERASANGDYMTSASRRECWDSTPQKAIVSTIKKRGRNHFSCILPFGRDRIAFPLKVVREKLDGTGHCLFSMLRTVCSRTYILQWGKPWSEERLSSPFGNEWVPGKEKSD